MRSLCGEVTDVRTPVNKAKLDSMKLECFNKILENSQRYYVDFYTSEAVEYEFDSEGFGEWVEEQLVEFHNLKECVYSQADEYEAKAKAFDEVLKSYDESLSEGHMADDVCNIVEKYKKQKEEL